MDKNNELANILRAELTLLTKDILQNIHQKDLKSLYKATRQLHEKMAAIMVLKEQLDTNELMKILKVQRGDTTATNVETEKIKPKKEHKTIEETLNVNESALQDKKKEKEINDISQQTLSPDVNPYKQVSKMRFVPKGRKESVTSKQSPKSSKVSKKMNIGLNDKISFIKHLFEGDQDFYSNFIDHLNAFEDYEEALKYINLEVKPLYNNWEGKDEYEFRLLQLLELKFA